MGQRQTFPRASSGRLSPLGHPLPSTGPAQLEAIRAHSTTSDQVHTGRSCSPALLSGELGDAVANAQRGANYLNICFPHGY